MKTSAGLLKPALAMVACALTTTALAAETAGVTDTTIKIGVMAPLTGSGSSYSKAEIGLDAYYKWVNDQGGVNGRKIETVLEDYACDSTKGIAAVKKLIHQDKVFMLHGNSCSAVAMAIKPIVVETGIPWVIAHAANGAISSPPTRNIFHGVPVGKTMGLAMGRFIVTKPGVTRVAVIQHTDDWAKSYCGPATEFLASRNIKPVVEVALERGQTDATAQTLRIKQANPDFVIACLYEAETAIFLKDARKFGLNAPVMGTAGTDLENTLKRVGDLDTVAGYYVPHMYADNLDGPRLKRFVDILKKYYPNESVTAFSLISMGGGAAVVEALKRAGRDLTRDKFIAELDRTKDFDTGVLAGRITWSAADRDGVKDVGIAGFVAGKPTVLKAWGQRL